MTSLSILRGHTKEVTLFGVNGQTTRTLPFIHHGFPSKQKKKLIKGYKHHSKKDIGLQLDVTFPVCNSNTNHVKSVRSSQYVTNNKACWRMRGINPNHVFSIQRNRPDKQGNITNNSSNDCQVSTPPSCNVMQSIDGEIWKLVIESVGPRTPPDSRTMSTMSEDEMAKALAERLDECDEELGVRERKAVVGRKLGNVLSTKRLKQILKNDEKTLPDIFYKINF